MLVIVVEQHIQVWWQGWGDNSVLDNPMISDYNIEVKNRNN